MPITPGSKSPAPSKKYCNPPAACRTGLLAPPGLSIRAMVGQTSACQSERSSDCLSPLAPPAAEGANSDPSLGPLLLLRVFLRASASPRPDPARKPIVHPLESN